MKFLKKYKCCKNRTKYNLKKGEINKYLLVDHNYDNNIVDNLETNFDIGTALYSIVKQNYKYQDTSASICVRRSFKDFCVENMGLSGCSNLSNAYYLGTPSELNSIYVKNQKHIFSDKVTVYYYLETEPTSEGNYWHYVDGVVTKWS